MTARLLVLGGTRFVGRAVVDSALDRYAVTLVTSDPSVPRFRRGARVVRVDRSVPGELRRVVSTLKGEWDAVIDTWQGPAAAVRESLDALRGRVATYCYVSSIAAYARTQAPFVEASQLISAQADSEHYAARKAEADALVCDSEHTALVVRPGLVVGPWEYCGRLPWWLSRLEAIGECPCPPPESPIQWTDVRDLAHWILSATERRLTGAFNFASPPDHATLGDVIRSCWRTRRRKATLVWVPDEVWYAKCVKPWSQLPLWIPAGAEASAYTIDASRAVSEGAEFRCVEETVRDVAHWFDGLNEFERCGAVERRLWVTREQQLAVLSAATSAT